MGLILTSVLRFLLSVPSGRAALIPSVATHAQATKKKKRMKKRRRMKKRDPTQLITVPDLVKSATTLHVMTKLLPTVAEPYATCLAQMEIQSTSAKSLVSILANLRNKDGATVKRKFLSTHQSTVATRTDHSVALKI